MVKKIEQWLLNTSAHILIIYDYIKEDNIPKHSFQIKRLKNDIKQKFLNHTELTLEKNDNIINNQIFTIYDSSIIDIKLTEQNDLSQITL